MILWLGKKKNVCIHQGWDTAPDRVSDHFYVHSCDYPNEPIFDHGMGSAHATISHKIHHAHMIQRRFLLEKN